MSTAVPAAPSITAYTATCAFGHGRAALQAALASGRGGLRANDLADAPLACAIGRVDGVEAVVLPGPLAGHDARNNRLAWLGLQADGFADAVAAAIARHGAGRVALLVGTSTGTIGTTEAGYRAQHDGRMPPALATPVLHTPHSTGVFLEEALGTRGPAWTIATACSSSAKVFAAGERLLRAGMADAVVVAGVDSLCGSVLYGFNALELVAREACRPFDRSRGGISIGEAAGFALLERAGPPDAPRLLGHGESSDAFHMSSPHPAGLGARRAIGAALDMAGLQPGDIDYLNLHGTASQKNDEVEAALVGDLFPPSTRASSTKGWSGHTLGAAGILEAVICLLALETGRVPGTLGCRDPEPAIAAQLALENESRPLRVALSNSFGFGGNNCALVFAAGQGHG